MSFFSEESSPSYARKGDDFDFPIQAENGINTGSDVKDFRNSMTQMTLTSNHDSLKPHISHGDVMHLPKPPVSKMMSYIPDYHHADEHYVLPSKEDIEASAKELTPKVQRAINSFKNAHGFCVAMSCERGCESGDILPEIHNGGDMFCKELSRLGYATFQLKNPSKTTILALYHVLTKNLISYPKSYSRLFLYFTGHGREHSISTHDGYISIHDLKKMLWPVSAPDLSEVSKILIFDCCRGSIDGYSTEDGIPSLENFTQDRPSSALDRPCTGNILIFYPSPLHCRTFADNDQVGFTTTELVKLLQTPKSQSLTDLLQCDLYNAVKEAVKNFPQCKEMHCSVEGTLEKPVYLHKEREEAMKPTDIKVKEGEHSCSITWKAPVHAAHQKLCGYDLVKRRPVSRYSVSHYSSVQHGGSTITCFNIDASDGFAGFELLIKANYTDHSVLSDAVRLENLDIAPEKVIMTKRHNKALIRWERSFHGDLYMPVGFIVFAKKISQCRSNKWRNISGKDPLPLNDTEYTSRSCSPSRYIFKVAAIYDDRSSTAKIAESEVRSDPFIKRRRGIYSSICLVPLLFLLIHSTYFGLVYGLVPHFNTLAIASDVIDCDILTSQRSLFYSTIGIKQTKSDERNDNEEGFEVDVFSVDRANLIFHNHIDSHIFIKTLTAPHTRFIIPYNYYNRPWYMRRNSKITLEFKLQKSNPTQTRAYAYIINGETNINKFLDRKHLDTEPDFEHKIDILDFLNSPQTVTLHNNGYYFVAVDITTNAYAKFMANVTFNFIYIDRDDYNLTSFQTINGNDDSVNYPLGISGKKQIFCYIHPLPPGSFASPSVHLEIEYINPRRRFVVIFPILLSLFFIGYLCFIAIVCVKYQRIFRAQENGYEWINS